MGNADAGRVGGFSLRSEGLVGLEAGTWILEAHGQDVRIVARPWLNKPVAGKMNHPVWFNYLEFRAAYAQRGIYQLR